MAQRQRLGLRGADQAQYLLRQRIGGAGLDRGFHTACGHQHFVASGGGLGQAHGHLGTAYVYTSFHVFASPQIYFASRLATKLNSSVLASGT